ncbi:MAG: glycoside hydrolase family 3 N-terminal domain-containing protein [Bacteroidales bacterium]|nr:glycoside hydrolase family 3 N-terminal domain-containing protein [Bacteroidales bacterium]
MNIRFPGWIFLFIATLTFSQLHAQVKNPGLVLQHHWVDSVYHSLTLDEKIGQLFFVRANYPTGGYLAQVDSLIQQYNVGGVVFFKGDLLGQARQTNRWNAMAKTPLLVSIDAEWGLGMRLTDAVDYPLQMTLGAMKNNHLIYEMGIQVAEQCRRMGIHINFAPVVDVNSNPLNPVIGMRSFGENPSLVAKNADMYMRGMQNGGIMACAKHFPGHGNTFIDSHADLPEINSPVKELLFNDLYPFSYLVNRGVGAVMIAHLSVPALDSTKNLPATLSKPIITDWLKDSLFFQGLIITDGLDMKGVTKYYKVGEVSLKALEAGNDVLLIPDDVPASIEMIKKALVENPLLMNRVEESCLKILHAKYELGAWKGQKIETDHLLADLSNPLYQATSDEMMQQAITLVKEEIPLPLASVKKMALLITGTEEPTEFEEVLLNTGRFDVFHLAPNANTRAGNELVKKLKKYPVVVVGVLNTNILASRRYGITEEVVTILENLAEQNMVVLDIFASPYALNFFQHPDRFSNILISYQEKPSMQRASALNLIEPSAFTGRLPVSADGYAEGWGIVRGGQMLYQSSPEELLLGEFYLKKIDSIAQTGIRNKAFPGCQILAAKDGAIFYHKSFGYHTYDARNPVQNTDVYDLASLTKILATTPAIMKLSDDSLIDIHGFMSDYLLMMKGTNKDSIQFMEALAHQAGFKNWIPFYKSTFNSAGLRSDIYQQAISEDFPTRVAENLYIRKGYEHVLLDSILGSPLRKKKYSYSDLAFYLFKSMTEQITNMQFDDFVYEQWYHPLKIRRLRFNPEKYFNMFSIIPTENDTAFRKQPLVGDVHDQGAAMLGGVSGNAGLFGDALDVAVMMQMFMNGGVYGEQRFFRKETLDFFTGYHFIADSNRRGLGFDKPMIVYKDHMANCKDASPGSFGHSGFTGTYAWADPENGLVYVFLSNRVYPDANNTKLMDMDIRTNIHQLFYKALKNTEIIPNTNK